MKYKSAIHYADDGATVRVEPGRGDYDLAVTRDGRTEFVEVKTPNPDTQLSSRYWDRQMSEMNKKFDNADNVIREDAVLEVHTTKRASELETAVGELEIMFDTRIKKNFGEVRIHSTNADTRVVTVDS